MSESPELTQSMDERWTQVIAGFNEWAKHLTEAFQPLLTALDAWKDCFPEPMARPFSTARTKHLASNRRRMLAYRRKMTCHV